MTAIETTKAYLKKPYILFLLLFSLVLYYSDFATIRPFWYDESLTITEFVSLPTYLDVYRYYQIANNHIVYSLILKFWIQLWESIFPFSEVPFRLLSFLFATATIALMWFKWNKRFGFWPTLITIVCFCSSLIFPIYSVAVRGYMLSLLLAFLALFTAEKITKKVTWKRLFSFFLITFLLVGTTPSNLFYLVAITCLNWPDSLYNKPAFKRWSALAITPLIAFTAFYLPIISKLLYVANITHGWDSSLYAIINYYAPIALTILPLLPFLVTAMVIDKKKLQFSHISLYITAIPAVLPLLLMLLRHPSPFPRVFIVFYPIYLFWLAALLNKLQAATRIKYKKNIAEWLGFYLCILVLGVASISHNLSNKLSSWTVPSGEQDDTLKPYFMHNYSPRSVIAEVKKMHKAQPLSILISNSADPPSLMLYSRFFGLPEQVFLFDTPKHKLSFTRDQINGPLICIVRNKDELPLLKKRFNINKMTFIKDFGFHKLFLAE
jgi:hypothetical protein